MTPAEKEEVGAGGQPLPVAAGSTHVCPEQVQLSLHKGFSAEHATGRQTAHRTGNDRHRHLSRGQDGGRRSRAAGGQAGLAQRLRFPRRPRLPGRQFHQRPCQFCLHYYADHAYYTPPLFDDFTAFDLVRSSVDRYLDGLKGIYDYKLQDVAPSTVIAAWDYAVGKPDPAWLKRRIGDIEKYAEVDDRHGSRWRWLMRVGNGCYAQGDDQLVGRIDWNWKDAYSSALAWRAFRCMADMEHRVGDETKANRYRQRADKIKAVYYRTFYNPQTGVLAGWRLKDGKFGDCYFLWANGIAISYGLVDKPQANAILDRLQAKIKEVGFQQLPVRPSRQSRAVSRTLMRSGSHVTRTAA